MPRLSQRPVSAQLAPRHSQRLPGVRASERVQVSQRCELRSGASLRGWAQLFARLQRRSSVLLREPVRADRVRDAGARRLSGRRMPSGVDVQRRLRRGNVFVRRRERQLVV
jgi:hypothetical protein